MILDVYSIAGEQLTNPGGNFSHNGYSSRPPSITPPNKVVDANLAALGDGVIFCGAAPDLLSDGGMETTPYVYLTPIGVGSSTNTFAMTVLGWEVTKLGVGTPLWIPITLAAYAVTLGTATGVANSDLGTTTLFATSITFTGGPVGVSSGMNPTSLDWFVISPGSNAIATIKQATLGYRFLEVLFTTGGSATSCNCLWRKG